MKVSCFVQTNFETVGIMPNSHVLVYSCHGSWVENDTTFIIARHAGSQHGVCISFLPQEGTAAKLVVGDTCKRSNFPTSDHHLTANLTVFGKYNK